MRSAAGRRPRHASAMSRAFVKEADDAGEPLPELAISPHPNFVTPAGLALIEQRVAALEAEQRAARGGNDKPLLARINRDLRYWTQRRASARLVPAAVAPIDVVRFGTHVSLRFDGRHRARVSHRRRRRSGSRARPRQLGLAARQNLDRQDRRRRGRSAGADGRDRRALALTRLRPRFLGQEKGVGDCSPTPEVRIRKRWMALVRHPPIGQKRYVREAPASRGRPTVAKS